MASQCVYWQGANLRLDNTKTADTCTTMILLDTTDYHFLMLDNNLTSADVLYFYTWGMGAILLPWSFAYATKWALKMIKIL